jgi:hypothetical protein
MKKCLPVTLSGFLCLAVFVNDCQAERTLSFNRDVRAILSDHCFACHGFDEKERQADLRLDTFEGAIADLGGRQAVRPRDVENSEIWKRIGSEDEGEVMPPAEFHRPLSTEQKEIIRLWIEQGAEYETHWSFIAPSKPPVPANDQSSNPIDSFISQRLQTEGLTASPQADKSTLIRRVTLDLTGLPPTPDEVDAFVNDRSPDAYESLVDDLLSRPAFGEQMARYWLDLSRYADTHGLHLDNERAMWPYRDWVVQAFNDNLPFDEFTRWQLAGDLLPNPSREQLIASGFNRCNVSTSEGGSIDEEWVYRYAVDRTSTAVAVWMGLTAGCAVCHDHKFDPLSTKEFYSMYSFFHSAADPAMDGNKLDTPPILKLTTAVDDERLRELDAKIAEVDSRIDKLVEKREYIDPTTIEPKPPTIVSEDVWFEDAFPAGTKPQARGEALKLVKSGEGQVFSGDAAIERTASGAVAQDYFNGGAQFTLPAGGSLFAYCFLDPTTPPQAIMLQFYVDGWKHRAIWGKEETIPFGKLGTDEKALMGELPELGKWVRLEIPFGKLGLKAGTKITGYAFTQFDGKVTWDRLGVATTVDPSDSPRWSWKVWKEQFQGKLVPDLTPELQRIVRGRKVEQWSKKEAETLFQFWLRKFYDGNREQLMPLEKEKEPFVAERTAIDSKVPLTMVMADLPKPRESFVMLRGQYDAPGEKVTRSVPSFLPPLPPNESGQDYNRLDLADWLLSREHPLTARVTVNRFWQQFFGTGLVKTSDDFGSQGEPPSHPELLDWLAVNFIDEQWDIKRFVKQIVCSSTYKQSTKLTPELLQKDPENRLLARGPRLRLDAEVLRDQSLFVSGLLVPSIGGVGVKPYQPANIWEPVGFGNSNTRNYKQDSGQALYRRSLYTFLKRTAPPPFMASFDAPNREQSCSRRGRSNTPMQALQLMNDIQHVEAARYLAQRVLQQGGDSVEDRVRWLWKVLTARLPSDDEVAIVAEAFDEHYQRYKADPTAALALVSFGESPVQGEIETASLAAWTMISNLVLNLDESLCKN